MKAKKGILVVLMSALLFLALGYKGGVADAKKSFSPVTMGVVNVRRVFENNQKQIAWQEKMNTERDNMLSELQKLQKQSEAIEAEMKTRKPGTSDFSNLMRQAMEKKAALTALQKYYEQDLMTREKQWTEDLYQQILAVIKKIAEQKDLDVVMATENFIFPSESSNELLLMIKTSKIMYSNDNLDITNEVLEALDKSK